MNALFTHYVYRYVFVCIALLVVIACWWFFGYRSIQASINNYKKHINTCNRQKKRYLTARMQCEQLAHEIKQLKQEYAQKARNTTEYSVTQALAWLIDCLKQHNILLQKCTLEKAQEQDWYMRIPCNLVYWATFDQLLALCSCLEHSPHYMSCESCVFKRLNDTMLSCTLRVCFIQVINKQLSE
jgi:Tfp pilus assembly protein PilO